MVTGDGYQLIEPSSLLKLMVNPSQAALTFAIMEWISTQFPSAFPQLSNKVTLEALPVTYLGTYPSLGIKYNSKDCEDLSEDTEAAVESILENSTVMQLLPYFAESTSDWCEVWQTLKDKYNGTS